MNSFILESGFFGKCNPEEIAAKYGTPVYVYNEDNIRAHMKAVAEMKVIIILMIHIIIMAS